MHTFRLFCDRSPEILPAPIAGATLRQPRGQRPRLRRHLLPAAVLRGGGGVRGGEMVMEQLVPPF